MQIEIVTSFDDALPFLETGPDGLPRETVPRPQQTRQWAQAWWDTFGHFTDGLRVLIARDGDETRCVFPMVIKARDLGRFVTVKRLQPLGAPLSDYCHPLYRGDPDAAAAALVEGFVRLENDWDELWLCQMLENDPLTSHLRQRLADAGLAVRDVQTAPCPYVDIDGPFDAYFGSLSKKLRQNHRTSLNRLERDGVEFSVDCRSGLDDALYETLVRVSAEGRYGDKLGNPRVKSWLQRLSALGGPGGVLEVWTISVEQNVAAYAICLCDGVRRQYFLVAGNALARSYSLGAILLHHIIERSFEEGLEEFDFLRGIEPYKLRWTSRTRPLAAFGALTQSRSRRLLLSAGLGMQRMADRLRGRKTTAADRILAEDFGIF